MSAQHSPITAVFPPPHLISTFDGVDIDRVRARQNKARIAVVTRVILSSAGCSWSSLLIMM
jgi:hypothetical protein